MASLGKQPDELGRAVEILKLAIEKWQAGYTTEAMAINDSGKAVDPTSPLACAWNFEGGLIVATEQVSDSVSIDRINSTVGYFHPWCGLHIVIKGANSTADEAIEITRYVIAMIEREITRLMAKSTPAQIS